MHDGCCVALPMTWGCRTASLCQSTPREPPETELSWSLELQAYIYIPQEQINTSEAIAYNYLLVNPRQQDPIAMSSRSIVRAAAQAARRPVSYSATFAVAARQLSTATRTSAAVGRRAPITVSAQQWTRTRRTYSQDSDPAAPEGESKIWSFEDVRLSKSTRVWADS